MSSSRLLRTSLNLARPAVMQSRSMTADTDKSGTVRGAGGAFAQKEKAIEDQYFYNLQKHQLEELRSHFHDEIKHHEESIKRHQDAIDRLRNKKDAIKDAQAKK